MMHWIRISVQLSPDDFDTILYNITLWWLTTIWCFGGAAIKNHATPDFCVVGCCSVQKVGFSSNLASPTRIMWIRIRVWMMVIAFVSWAWIRCLQPIFPFPKPLHLSSMRTMADSGRLWSSISLSGYHVAFYIRSARQLWTRNIQISPYMITFKRERNTNKQTKVSSHSVVDRSASPCLFGRFAASAI